MKGFRIQIVASTVLLVTAVMVVVVAGTQWALELSEGHPRFDPSWRVLIATSLVGGCGVVLSAVVAWWVSHRALQPVRQMSERAEEWSAHNLAHRFDLGPPDTELSQLGLTLDHLLDRVANAIRDEQRLTAELAHEIRTPLTSIRGSAELALLRSTDDPGLRIDLNEIADGCQRLADVVTALLDIAQSPGAFVGSTDPDAVITQLSGLIRDPIELRVTGTAAAVAGPLLLVVRALAPLIENASRHARTYVNIELRIRGALEFAVTDDGPGVAPELVATLFEPGTSHHGSSGLGLAIARRIARSLGGDVIYAHGEFVLSLPRA